uniref:Uncharacterized protein n=1 Tax=Plectus sambesii TaxID=2011161 RepID=A0A914XH60_9BILA
MASGQQMLAPSSTAMHKATGGSEARFIPVTISGGNGSSAPQTAVAAGANGLAGSGNGGTQRGYTILVPANVRFRGVNMQLDLKIDQKTLAAASSISKAVQDAVNARQCGAGGGVHSRLQAATTSSSSATMPLEAGDVDCLDRSATLSNSLRLKTGGRNPREILAEKLRKINGKRSSNGSLVTRSAAPSPSWYKRCMLLGDAHRSADRPRMHAVGFLGPAAANDSAAGPLLAAIGASDHLLAEKSLASRLLSAEKAHE